MDEPVCFVPTDPDPVPNGDAVLLRQGTFHGYRRLERGWTDAATSRVRDVVRRAVLEDRQPDHDEIRAALFPPSEPEPEEWEREAARTWGQRVWGNHEPIKDYDVELARHFAKARRAQTDASR